MKKYLSGLTAILLAIAISAFISKDVTSKKFAEKWFVRAAGANPEIAGNYGFVASVPSCPGSAFVCAILVNDTDGDNVVSVGELAAFKAAHGITGSMASATENDAYLRKRTTN